MQNEINALAKNLKAANLDDRQQSKMMSDFHASHQKALEQLADELNSLAAQQNSWLQGIYAQHHVAGASMLPWQMAQQKVLNSLHFTQIEAWQDRVRNAHVKTFRWILKPASIKKDHGDDFLRWIESRDESNGIFWVRGKAGSGKSTLLRYLDDNVCDTESFSKWAGDLEGLKANCFFWNSGTKMQRSMPGLLRCLLYQLLQERPELISRVVSTHRWEDATRDAAKKWSEAELRETLLKLANALSNSARILLIVDGLDEFEGSDQQRSEMVALFKTLTRTGNVKACLSSRPWNIYLEELEAYPKLCLEVLTYDDIRNYVHARLELSDKFQRLKKIYPEAGTITVSPIVQKARGVFLWVVLVVEELLRGLRDGDSLVKLQQTIEEIPADLDEYFMRMLQSIPLHYRREASALLQIKRFQASRPDIESLPLMTLAYFDNLRPDFVLQPGFEVFDWSDNETGKYIFDCLRRRLNSRCMGLLEIHHDSFDRQTGLHLTAKVEFLHRTVRDFLLDSGANRILNQFTDVPVDAQMFHCNRLLSNLITLTRCHPRFLPDDLGRKEVLIDRLIKELASRPASDKQRTEDMVEKLKPLLEIFAKGSSDAASWLTLETLDSSSISGRSLKIWTRDNNSFITLAINSSWTSYVESHLTKDIVQGKQGRPFLAYVLNAFMSDEKLKILATILEHGANPNELFHGASVWMHFLKLCRFFSLQGNASDLSADCKQRAYSALSLFIANGAADIFRASAWLQGSPVSVNGVAEVARGCLTASNGSMTGGTPERSLLQVSDIIESLDMISSYEKRLLKGQLFERQKAQDEGRQSSRLKRWNSDQTNLDEEDTTSHINPQAVDVQNHSKRRKGMTPEPEVIMELVQSA
jgi:hypothetical protein